MERLISASPLMPVFLSVFLFIGILSPLTWSVNGYLTRVFVISIALSIVCSCCVTAFIEEMKD